jgi:hypothetical protein
VQKQPPQEHREIAALLAELLEIRDRESTKQALCQQIQACVRWQESLQRWLVLSRTPNLHWHGCSVSEVESLLRKLEQERQDLSRALVDLLQTRPRNLTADEEALLDRYEEHEFPEPPPPGAPDLAEPGSPEKVALLAGRFASGRGLWHPGDARLEPTERTGYQPRHAKGNFALVGRQMILLLLNSAPDAKETA